MSNLEPSDVADAIVEALQHGHRRRVGAEVGEAHQHARRAAAARALGGDGARDEGRPRARGRRPRPPPRLRAARLALGAGPRAGRPSSRRSADGAGELSARGATGSAAAGQPLGDQAADQRALVLLQEVARVRRSCAAAGGRSPRRSARRWRAAAPGPSRPTASASGGGRPCSASSTRWPAAAPGRVGRRRDHQRERARAGLRGGVSGRARRRRRSPRRPGRSCRRRGRGSRPAGPRCARRSRGRRSTRRSSAGGR